MTMVNYLIDNKGFSIYDDNNNSIKSKVYKNIELYISTKSSLYLEDLDEIYPHSKAFIFLSRHRSESGIPTLTCHCTGQLWCRYPLWWKPARNSNIISIFTKTIPQKDH